MTKNPFINALSASAYIILVVTIMNFASQILRNKPDTAFGPVALLSLLTLSVTVMAYLFFYQPLQLFIERKKKQGLNLFIQTVGIFGVITGITLILLFMRII